MNYFVHREMNLKKTESHNSVRFGFLDLFLDEQNLLNNQCL